MKNVLKAFGTQIRWICAIALAAFLVFSFTTCVSGDDEITNVPVTGVTLNKSSISLNVGSKTTLTATVAPDNATNKEVTWTTGNAAVATVTNGTVTAVAAGSATIIAATADGGKTATCSVTVIDSSLLNLSGTITINPSTDVTTFTELTATYSGLETVSYQWKKDGSNVGTNSNKYTPTTAGSYTVTVSATGYNSKTSAVVDVNDSSLYTLSGDITISPNSGVTTFTELTATYSGSETVSYQWKKGDTNVGINSKKYTPRTAGSYTVTVSAAGYNSKTSSVIDVNDPSLSTLSGNITINPNSGVTTFTELIATYSGSETINYQWEKDGSSVVSYNNTFTPTEEGSYTVTVSAAGYNSKTSAAVYVVLSELSGTITISPVGPVIPNTELTATYNGSETGVQYWWYRNGNLYTYSSNIITPYDEGSYTVTISAPGYNSKTSAAVTVAIADLSGTITISPVGPVTPNTELTATYSGSEHVIYQWYKNGNYYPYSNNTITPYDEGSYTVTVSAQGYNSKTSAAVTVVLSDLSGTITISPVGPVTPYTELTATYSGSETGVKYQWYKNGSYYYNSYYTNTFTPTEEGSYTVTVSRTGYNSKTSAAVTVVLSDLSGDINISPSGPVTPYTELTVTYSGSETEVQYQWNKNGSYYSNYYYANKFTPIEEGSYTVTVSAKGYNSKTSAAVTVVKSDLSGNITISPVGPVTINKQLTAEYSGSETVIYQWKKDGDNVGTNSNEFTPTTTGSYIVTVSKTGYNDKTSAPVTVAILDLKGTITISPSTDATTFKELTATYNAVDGEYYVSNTLYNFNYQWKNGSTNVGTNSRYFTPTQTGDYTVTISKPDYYNSKTSTPVTVTGWSVVDSSTFGNNTIYAIAYGNNKFVAVGYSGKMATSTDGITWTAVANSTFGTSPIRAITYGNGKFVAGGYDGKMAISTDGVTWTAVNTGSIFDYVYNGITSKETILAIAYGNNKFVAGCTGGKMATSTNGVAWTAITNSTLGISDDNTTSIYAITYGNNKFVAGNSSGRMATSPDGTTWTAVADSTFSSIGAITYGNGKFVAVGSGKMATSPDGTTWTAVADSTFFSSIGAITYGNGKFVAIDSSGKMATSTDGITWTDKTTGAFGTTSNFTAIAYGNNKFVAYSCDSNKGSSIMVYSPDNY